MLALVLAKKPSTLSSRSMSLLSGGTRPEEALHPERFQIGIGGEIISECGDFISESQAI
jgi:hypothetical protein